MILLCCGLALDLLLGHVHACSGCDRHIIPTIYPQRSQVSNNTITLVNILQGFGHRGGFNSRFWKIREEIL